MRQESGLAVLGLAALGLAALRSTLLASATSAPAFRSIGGVAVSPALTVVSTASTARKAASMAGSPSGKQFGNPLIIRCSFRVHGSVSGGKSSLRAPQHNNASS